MLAIMGKVSDLYAPILGIVLCHVSFAAWGAAHVRVYGEPVCRIFLKWPRLLNNELGKFMRTLGRGGGEVVAPLIFQLSLPTPHTSPSCST